MPFVLNAVTGWHDADPDDAEAHADWARGRRRRGRRRRRPAAPTSTSSGDADAAASSYGEETYARLVALKNEYDPTNVFRLNQNIEPDENGG